MAKERMLTAIEKAQVVKLLGQKKSHIRNFSKAAPRSSNSKAFLERG